MAYRVILTATARRDLREIIRFISRDSPQRGAHFAGRMIASTERLGEFPELGRVLPEMMDPLIREIVFRSYRVIYQVDDSQRRVLILRFWHAARGEPRIDR